MNDDLVSGLVGETLEIGSGRAYGVVHEAHMDGAGTFVASVSWRSGGSMTLRVRSGLFQHLTAGVDSTEELSTVVGDVLDGKLTGAEALDDAVAIGTPPGPMTGPYGPNVPAPKPRAPTRRVEDPAPLRRQEPTVG